MHSCEHTLLANLAFTRKKEIYGVSDVDFY